MGHFRLKSLLPPSLRVWGFVWKDGPADSEWAKIGQMGQMGHGRGQITSPRPKLETERRQNLTKSRRLLQDNPDDDDVSALVAG